MTQELVQFSKIVDEIQRLCDRKTTGSLFITTSSNRSAQMMFDSGRIVYIYCSNKRGSDAVQMMSSIDSGKFRFQEGPVPAQSENLPPTSEILKTLIGFAQGAKADSAPADSTDSGKPSVAPVESLTAKQKSVLEDCLAEYIGPMASIICEDHFETAHSVESAMQALQAEIPSVDQAKQFRQQVLARLK